MVVHSPFPIGEPRGEREARAAVEAGYDVHVISLRLPGDLPFERVGGIDVIRLPIEHVRGGSRGQIIREYGEFAVRATIATLALNRRSRIDVVYVHAPPDFLIVAALLPRLLGSKVVLDIHDLSPHMYNARFGGDGGVSLAERALRGVQRAACALADRVVTVHEPYRTELAAAGVAPGKMAIVMNAPDQEVLDLARKGSSERRPSDRFTVAYHGTLTHWYGVDLLVEAVARLRDRIPNLQVVILGEGDALGPAERLANERGIQDRVEFSRAYVSQVEALERVAGASCGVIPNRRSRLNRFALSSKLFEYVALGVPVVVSRLETLAAHFSPEEVTFFEPDDEESLVEAIAWVAEHPAAAREKASRAHERAQAYSWPESHARLLEVLSCARS